MLPKLDSGFHVFRLDYQGTVADGVTQISMYLDNATTPYSTDDPGVGEGGRAARGTTTPTRG